MASKKQTTEQAANETAIALQPVKRTTIDVPIEGVTPLIPHRWSEKALRQMRDKQTGPKAQQKRETKDIEAEAEASLYRLDDGRLGMPATAFAAATKDAARFYDGLTLVTLRRALFVHGEGSDQLVPIDAEMTMREDTPRNNSGNPDLRYRYSLWPWSAVLKVEYLEGQLDAQSAVNLVDAGGNGGVGDWRPSAPKSMTGTFGRYQVKVS